MVLIKPWRPTTTYNINSAILSAAYHKSATSHYNPIVKGTPRRPKRHFYSVYICSSKVPWHAIYEASTSLTHDFSC